MNKSISANPLNLHLFGVFSYDCVEGIGRKVEVIETLCSASIKFAEAITTITSVLLAMDISKIMGKLKDMVRMLRLSDLLGHFAAEMLKLIECVGDVFDAVKAKISTGLPNMNEWKASFLISFYRFLI